MHSKTKAKTKQIKLQTSVMRKNHMYLVKRSETDLEFVSKSPQAALPGSIKVVTDLQRSVDKSSKNLPKQNKTKFVSKITKETIHFTTKLEKLI